MLTPPPAATFGQRFARACLQGLGWQLVCPARLPAKAVIVAYPHTSNWDFLFGMLGKFALGLDVHWVGKDSLFCWPVAWLLKAWGGIPVNRRQPEGFVDQMAARFADSPALYLAIAPEGTRSLTPGWKTGFYRIARGAGVPLVLAAIDYGRRQVGLIDSLDLSGDAEADLAAIAQRYAGRRGLHPERAAPVRWVGNGQPPAG